jgi:hypothetical protein
MFERKYKILDDKLVKRDKSIPVPEDEPLFILRAKDRKALPALLAYHMILDRLDQKEAVTKCIKDFREFQEKHPELMGEPEP